MAAAEDGAPAQPDLPNRSTATSQLEISVSTLGRNMEVGMLYDCCTDSPIMGELAWSREDLKKRYTLNDPSTSLVFITEDESEDVKMERYFQISASLQASILSGLVTLGGAAKYLKDNTQTSNMHKRVMTLHYEMTTKQVKIPTKDFRKLPEVRHKNATHIVTSVTYGANAFLVFYDASAITKNSHKKDLSLKANLEIAFTNQIENKNELSYKKTEDESAESAEKLVSCTLYGDCTPKQNPTNYQQALKFCRELPKLCETQVVPVRITLTPLSVFGKTKHKIVEIDHNALSIFVNNMNALERMSESCRTLMQHMACVHFPSYRTLIHKYFRQIDLYINKFKRDVARLLPKIRRGVNPSKLQKAVTRVRKSPFMPRWFNCWINGRTKELRDLEGLLEHLPGIQVIETPEDFKYVVTDPKNEKVVCFALPPILHHAAKYLTVLKQYTNSEDPGKNNVPHHFCHFELHYERNAFGFYQESSVKQNDKTTFVVTSFIHNSEIEIKKTGSILVFTGGEWDREHFERTPVLLKKEPGKGGACTFFLSWTHRYRKYRGQKYKVAYRKKSSNKGKNKGDYIEVFTEEKQCTIEGLSKNATYEFQVFADYSAWTSMGSEKVTYSTPVESKACTVM